MDRKDGYDVIIVGAGSSGAILASRLSEDPNRQVLLIESGSDYRIADAPAEMRSPNPLAIQNPELFPQYNWPELLVRRTPQQAPRVYDRGRGPGGSSAINWQVAHRAMLEDYDTWAEQGCIGWSGEELLPAMNRLENDLDFGDAPYHGNRGPVIISRPPISAWGKVDLALLEVALDLGHPWHDDLNAPGSTGVCPTPLNRTEDDRMSTNTAYLEPARDRSNLTICGDCHADRVIFDGHRAIGIRAIQDGSPVQFYATEIILSAGSTFSPPILMRSGIGPADELRALEIEVLADLPVGKNLIDHASVGLRLELSERGRCADWNERHSNCYVRYTSGLAGAGENDMVLVSRNSNGFNAEGLTSGAMVVIIWQSFSRGELRLTSIDPLAMPQIDENLLSDERDMIRLRDGARRLFEIAESKPIRSITSDITLARAVTDTAGMRIRDLQTDRDLDEWMMQSVRDTWHLVGTCRMGSPHDPRTVVDTDCRVLGMDNLRVIDGSIMPEVPRANTNLTCMTIAEHMAARISSPARR